MGKGEPELDGCNPFADFVGLHPEVLVIPSPDAHILFPSTHHHWEKDASGRYEHKTLINLMKSSSPWLLPGEDGRAVAKGGT